MLFFSLWSPRHVFFCPLLLQKTSEKPNASFKINCLDLFFCPDLIFLKVHSLFVFSQYIFLVYCQVQTIPTLLCPL